MTEREQIAWAAGLFEGEGSICVKRDARTERVYMRLVMSTTDRDVMERFAEVVACGNVTGPTWHTMSKKPIWRWCVSIEEEVRRLADLFSPFLGKRRRTALLEMFYEIENQPPPRHYYRDRTHCKRGHELTEGNIMRWGDGVRRCRTCERDRSTRRRHTQIEDVAARMQELMV